MNSVNDTLKDYILKFERLMPHDLCDRIVRESIERDQWESTAYGRGNIDETIRNCMRTSPSDATDKSIFEVVGKALALFKEKYPMITSEQDQGYDILRYNPGGKFVAHTDSSGVWPREVTLSFLLNDDFTGGDWSFFKGEYEVTPKKGDALMFPANFMFTHEIKPVLTGTRYSIVTWFI